MPTCYRDANAALIARYQQGDAGAADEILKKNAGLVWKMIHRYGHMSGSLDQADLLIEGQLGLLEAARRFDLSRGLAFSTFANWYVRSAVQSAIESGAHAIRLPSHLHEKVRAASRNGEEPAWVAALPRVVASLDEPSCEDDDEGLLLDSMAGPADVAAEVVEGIANAGLGMCLACLRPKERYVTQRRFGLDDMPEESLREVADRLAMSREAVRQIELRALRRLRGMVSPPV